MWFQNVGSEPIADNLCGSNTLRSGPEVRKKKLCGKVANRDLLKWNRYEFLELLEAIRTLMYEFLRFFLIHFRRGPECTCVADDGDLAALVKKGKRLPEANILCLHNVYLGSAERETLTI